jgi:hypothetical protein
MSDYYLVHHGVKGQKWGVRRYQNADGSLKRTNNANKQTTRKQRNNMTDSELQQRINRLEKEIKLKDLEKRNIDSGKSIATDILKNVGTKTITTLATGASVYAAKALVTGKFDAQEFGDAIFRGGAKKK